MIVLSRVLARDFRALLGRCVSGRPRGPAPPITVWLKDGLQTLSATTTDGIRLSHSSEAPNESDDEMVLPATVLAEVEGGADEPVRIERQSKLRAQVRWPVDDQLRSMSIELIRSGTEHDVPASPDLTLVPATVLTALHECGRTTARDQGGRFALTKIQLQGKGGRIVGTDGRAAILWRGFTFPFADDVLVPAIPVFGSKPLALAGEVSLGRTETYLVIGAGPWSVWLPTDTKSRFPDVAGIVPRCPPTTAGIDEQDAAVLLKSLPGLPGADHENRPVTLDADRVVRVRARDDSTGAVKEVTLIRSPTAGPAAQVVLDRRVLARMLSLGCHTLHLTPGKPLSADGDDFTFIAATLDPILAVPPSDDATKVLTDAEKSQGIVLSSPNPERKSPMKLPPTNGHGPNDRHDPPTSDQPDPLVAAEELRLALADATTKATRLINLLKASRKEKKALANVWAGLKSLNLGNGGG